MRKLVPLRWSEGMFLKPQHFQQADLYQDGRLAYHLRLFDPFHWGVSKLRVAVDALENLIFRVEQCELVFPEGLAVVYPDGASLKDASFQDAFPATAEVLGVYLAVRRPTPEDGFQKRFIARADDCRDLLMRDNEASIEFLVPEAHLVFAQRADDPGLAGMDAIRIAEVRRTGLQSPRFELSPTYAPPAMSLHASPVLVGKVKEVFERCCAYSRTLGQHLREHGGESVGYGTGNLEKLLSRQAVNQFIPALQNALANESMHPYAVYGLLGQLYGALTTFFPDEEAWGFPAYDHSHLAGCILPLCASISRLLERLLPTHYLQFKLQRDGFQFATELDDTVFARGQAFVLAVRGPGGEENLRRRIDERAKVSSVTDMRELRTQALRGVPLRYVEYPPAEIPRLAGYLYYQIDVGDRRFGRVREGKSFAFYLVEADPEFEAQLFVVLGAERKGT